MPVAELGDFIAAEVFMGSLSLGIGVNWPLGREIDLIAKGGGSGISYRKGQVNSIDIAYRKSQADQKQGPIDAPIGADSQ